ncbi:MAG: methylase involved in ubiquinone/menaquinone biosynthesi [Halanaerobium sp. 4-GBenrich]|jgi:ubiquinone/menaquinone biosynthesis C-methylase UbiE|uniref:Ubiquinone/menaquinone biosynthesis C-methylase UbiE n=4 Tax=Halanaerobium TaxID=2330 RepID=A0A1G6RN94_9FIRM|nr:MULTISPECIES: class I SAM-dependent methyltransferase [Halanaerobium]ODS50843.1 MAG: methylase involved in ubiquinone/menaquinone biosynthesi [Halanaerobium sp. 4-GBenrich]PUU93242.1 MAG: methylase involved in ubiquinone/menaquinone biosynthesi [Halanaerobium sp.]PTV98240.1 ubiquinone/menaquinone biosynthesis C-methylase UbiE [Halanaerobium saccharolyticum]PTX17762.1 ubiquinone/menaquinone biosynthesis C-methylase UbiE [Halanaerobium congolense]TDS28238.1 ubiquinone/menaquinone biosynthesis
MSENNKIKKRYDRVAPVYDSLEYLMEKGKMGDWRQNLWQRVEDKIDKDNMRLLEAGVGSGKNIEYYPDNIEIYAIDFSPKMIQEAEKKAKKYNREVKLLEMDIQDLNFEDNNFDLIVTSCVFCSVPDPVKGLKELKRVLKKDGRIIMLEHMRSQNELVGKLMDLFNWVSLYTWGANINRKTIENIEKAGLKLVEVNDLMSDIVKEIELKK